MDPGPRHVEFPDDANVSPAWVLARETQSQLAQLGVDARPPRPAPPPRAADDAVGVASDSGAADIDVPYQDIQLDGRLVRMWDVVGRDAIPAVFDPAFVTGEEAAAQLTDEDFVIGVSISGEHRAYGIAFLSRHEVVNDVVGGRPIAVTW